MAKGLTPPREKSALSIILTDQSFYHTIVSDTGVCKSTREWSIAENVVPSQKLKDWIVL